MKNQHYTFFLILLSFLSFFGCGKQDYSFTKVMLSTERDSKTRIISSPTDTFNNNTPIIYGQATFFSPTSDQEIYIQIVFNLDKNGQKSPVNSANIRTKASGIIVFKIDRPSLSWTIGDYTADFIINEKTIYSHPFKIIPVEQGEIDKKAQWLENVTTSKNVDSAHLPLEATTIFSGRDQNIFLSLTSNKDMPSNTQIKTDWRYLDNQQNIASQTQTINPNQSIHFTIDKKSNNTFLNANGNWPSGDYQIDIYLDNTYVKFVQFEIK